MGRPSLLWFLLLLTSWMAGCSQSWGIRNGSSDGVRTIASVGDRNLPIRSGTPDSSVRTGVTEPIIANSGTGRISGRVYDDQNQPVPNARVRLGVGAEAGGKAVTAITDKSGAFTIRGVRPGSTYTVIADYQGRNGTLSGRAETEAPDANVRISLKRRRADRDDARTSIKPAQPSVAPVSNIEESDEPPGDDQTARINKEDLGPPPDEADSSPRGRSDLSGRRSAGERAFGSKLRLEPGPPIGFRAGEFATGPEHAILRLLRREGRARWRRRAESASPSDRAGSRRSRPRSGASLQSPGDAGSRRIGSNRAIQGGHWRVN